MPKSAASGKPRCGQHWPRQLLSLVANKGSRNSWRNWEISPWHHPHPHSAKASLSKATSPHQVMEGLQGVAFWVTGRQSTKISGLTQKHPWMKTTSAALTSQPHWAGWNYHWADPYLCLFHKQKSQQLRWQSLEDRRASYISSALDKIQ